MLRYHLSVHGVWQSRLTSGDQIDPHTIRLGRIEHVRNDHVASSNIRSRCKQRVFIESFPDAHFPEVPAVAVVNGVR